MKPIDLMLDYYKERATWYDNEALWISEDVKLLSLHLDAIDRKYSTALDVATGTGIIGSLLRRSGIVTFGIDVSRAMLEVAKTRLGYLIQGSAEHLPFAQDSFDLVTCRQGLHYMNPRDALAEFLRVCRYLVLISEITCRNEGDADWWWKIFRVLSPGRRVIFTERMLIELMQNSGFRGLSILRYEGKNSLKRWIGKRTLPQDVLINLMQEFKNAPEQIKNSYEFCFSKGDYQYIEPWVIIAGRKERR